VDLTVRQYADHALLSLSMPAENTNGSEVTEPNDVELFRLSSDMRGESHAVGEDEFLKRSKLVLSIRADRIRDYLQGNTLVLTDDLSSVGPASIYTRSFRYAVRFINRKKQTAGLGNQAYLAPLPIPGPPAGFSFEQTPEFVRLKWESPDRNMDGSTPARVAGYNIYRSENPKVFLPSPLNQQLSHKPEFEDRTFQFDTTYYYAVSVVGSPANPYAESLPCAPMAVATRDTFPPGIPQNLNVVAEAGVVILLWAAPADRDIAGYRIYRREEGESTGHLLQTELIRSLSYRDEKVPAVKKYIYRVTAVDTHGNEGQGAEAAMEPL